MASRAAEIETATPLWIPIVVTPLRPAPSKATEYIEGCMQPRGVFLLQSDSQIAQLLLASLSGPFDPVETVHSAHDLREVLRRSTPGVAIVDVEAISLPDLSALVRDFPTISFVCNHRSPDEKLWVETMNAGAADCCPSDDVAAILHAVISSASIRSAAA